MSNMSGSEPQRRVACPVASIWVSVAQALGRCGATSFPRAARACAASISYLCPGVDLPHPSPWPFMWVTASARARLRTAVFIAAQLFQHAGGAGEADVRGEASNGGGVWQSNGGRDGGGVGALLCVFFPSVLYLRSFPIIGRR